MVPTEDFDVNLEGIPLNEKLFQVSGGMQAGLADRLPFNYFPVTRMKEIDLARETLKRFQEKIYVHTDKPFYYPGEVMWLKAYVNYYEPAFEDSLSNVMYVELINAKREVVLTRILRIGNRYAKGDLLFPNDLNPGKYYLRA